MRSKSGGCTFHTHSMYSLLDGASSPADLCDRAKQLGYRYFALSDHGTVMGHLDAYDSARESGLVPILGSELYHKDEKYDNGKPKGFHLCVWGMNETGLRNVWAISSNSYYGTGEGHRNPNCHWSDFEGHGKGVACSSACLAGALSTAAKNDDEKMADYFVDRFQSIFEWFYIEIHTNSEPEQRPVNLWLMKYAKKRHIPVVYAVDAHYARKEDSDFHDVWLGCQIGAHYDDGHWTMKHDYYLQGEDEIAERLSYLGSDEQLVFDGIDDFLSHVEEYEIDTSHKVPNYPLPDGWENSDDYLVNLVVRGMLRRVIGYDVPDAVDDVRSLPLPKSICTKSNLDKLRPYIDQLVNEELPIILENGLSDYFLVTSDYCNWAKGHMLIGPGRGSCVGSMVCYFLGITEIDPLGKGLFFSRFLNQGRLETWKVEWADGTVSEDIPAQALYRLQDGGEKRIWQLSRGDVVESWVRCLPALGNDGVEHVGKAVESAIKVQPGSLPDVDSDFPPSPYKDSIADYLVEKYGEKYVSAVGTVTFYKIKNSVHDACRYYRIDMQDTVKLANIVDDADEVAGKGVSWREGLKKMPPDKQEFVKGIESEHPKLMWAAEKMQGLAKNKGKHAAGYVISPVDVSGELPIYKSSNDEIISQFDKWAVERMGFLKADLLGLRNLITLMQASDLVKKRTGDPVDYYHLQSDPEDMAVWSLFDDGDTLAVFQLEGQGITGVAQALKPRSVSDLAIILALYRPGVINAKAEDGKTSMLDEYIARATGQKEVEYIVPQLEPILNWTYGTVVMQEQSMQIFTDVAGLSAAEADHLRSAIGKKKIDKMKAEKPKYLAGCARNGVPADKAELIWSQIEASAGYAFNYAHSLAYATISFWTAYMKAHHFAEYYAACMSTVAFDKVPKYVLEARKRGVEVLPPRLSALSRDFTVTDDGKIVFGLVNMKGVGESAIDSIMEHAPYRDFPDFASRAGVNSSVVKTLIKVGVFSETYPNSKDLLRRYENGTWDATLFGEPLCEESRIEPEQPPYTTQETVRLETEILGMPVSVDEFEDFREQLGPMYGAMEQVDGVEAARFDTLHKLLVKVTDERTHMARTGVMAFDTFQTDGGDEIEATVFPSTYEVVSRYVYPNQYLVIEVKKQEYRGRSSYILEQAIELKRRESNSERKAE